MPRKRGDTWHARLQIDGRRIEVSAGAGASRRDALALEARIRSDHIDGKLGRKPQRTIEQALVKWLEGEASRLKSYRNLLGKVSQIEPYCTGVPLARIAEAADQIKADGIKLKLAAATINRRLAILRRVANLAYNEWQWLDQPLGQRIKLLGGERRRDVFLTPAQAQTIISHCQHARVADAMRLACLSGLREGELLRLTPQHLRDGCIVLDSNTKSGKPRVVPLPPEALTIALPLGITYATLRTWFERARTDAGMPGVRFHDLRHTYASWFLQSGGSLKALSLLLGHSTIAITADIYGHLESEHLRAGVAGMGRVLASGAKMGQTKRKPAQ